MSSSTNNPLLASRWTFEHSDHRRPRTPLPLIPRMRHTTRHHRLHFRHNSISGCSVYSTSLMSFSFRFAETRSMQRRDVARQFWLSNPPPFLGLTSNSYIDLAPNTNSDLTLAEWIVSTLISRNEHGRCRNWLVTDHDHQLILLLNEIIATTTAPLLAPGRSHCEGDVLAYTS